MSKSQKWEPHPDNHLTKLIQGPPEVQGPKTYTLKHLKDETLPGYDDSWEDKGHTLTVIAWSNNHDYSLDELFFDHVHIHPNNWQWLAHRKQLVFSQGPNESFIGGHITFSHDSNKASGSIQLASESMLVQTVRGKCKLLGYSIDVSTRVGASIGQDGSLMWNSSTEEWANDDNWANNVMTYRHWVEDSGLVLGNQKIFQTANVFSAPDGVSDMWDVQPRGPEGAATTTFNSSYKLQFALNDGYTPELTRYPYKMDLQFDQSAEVIEGGAMLCRSSPSDEGYVSAIRGKKNNHYVVGSYRLVNSDPTSDRPLPSIQTHGGKLVVDGKLYENSWMSEDKLHWSGVDQLPAATGYVKFTPDGTRIIDSSFGVEGCREYASEGTRSSLNFFALINMNPYEQDANGKISEVVQQNSMEDFYKIVQYFMPPELLHNFISLNPPDLGKDVGPIANDNADNKEFYANLATPYLASALKSANRDSVKYLNARRAQRVFKQRASVSPIYDSQSTSLYTLEWNNKFRNMKDFLADQSQNTQEQQDAIDKECRKWKKEIKKGMDYLDKDEVQQMITIADDCANVGKTGKYWAFLLFRYFCGEAYLSQLQLLMLSGNNSQSVTQQIQQYCSILSVLDTTGHFVSQYHAVMMIQELTGLLPSFFDVENNWEDVTLIMEKILNAFIEKYGDSPDPAIKQRVQDLEKALQTATQQDMMSWMEGVVVAGNQSFGQLVKNVTKKFVDKLGILGKSVANLFLLSVVGLTTVQLCTGMIDWNTMTGAEQTAFIGSCFKVITTMLRKGIEAAVAYESTANVWESMKVFFGKQMSVYEDTVTSALGKWVTNNVKRVEPGAEGLRALFFEESSVTEDYPRFCKMFGRSLDEFMATRFAAVMAIIGIVTSAFGLAESHDPLSTAMNSLFLLSSILDLAAVAGEWLISAGIEEIGSLAIASVVSCITPLSILAGVAGLIVMIVKAIEHKEPPNPIDEFVDNQAKDDGLYMDNGASLDYLVTVNDSDGKPQKVGVSFNGGGETKYLTVNADGSLTTGAISYSVDTVLTIDVDYRGYTNIFAKIFTKRQDSEEWDTKVVGLTAKSATEAIMGPPVDKDEENKQFWIGTCTGNAKFDEQKALQYADFHLKNVFFEAAYLSLDSDNKIILSSTPHVWTLTMEYMKPDFLTMKDVILYPSSVDRKFYPNLRQTGSLTGQEWFITPDVPDCMEFDSTKGTVSQKSGEKPPADFPESTYTMTVRNAYGKTSTEFVMKLKQ